MRKRLKKKTYSRQYPLYIASVAALIIAFFWWTDRRDSTTQAANIPMPAPYSDSRITQNAKISDPRFADTLAISGGSSAASILSALRFHKTQVLPKAEGSEKGTWLWTPVLEITPQYRDAIIAGARRDGITAIYLSIDSYLDIFAMPDGSEKEALRKKFSETLADFIVHANKAGIAVDAEGGWRNWAEPGHTYKAHEIVAYAIDFNATHETKLRGFQYDVEPYLLEMYQSNRTLVLRRFTALVDTTLDWLYGSDLKFSVVIPDFYDTKLAGKYVYEFHYADAIAHLVRLLDRRTESSIIVMAYRNFADGENGAIDISRGEVNRAADHTTRVIVASEFGDVPPSYVTYFNTSRSRYNAQIAEVLNAFSGHQSFGGISLHYINAYLALR